MPHSRAGAAASTAFRLAARMPSWSYRSAVISRAYGSYLRTTVVQIVSVTMADMLALQPTVCSCVPH